MKTTKRLISVILCIAILFSFSACSLSAENESYTVGVLGNVKSFDPLKAESDIEKILSTNCFEGLLRFDSDSRIDPAGATAYTVESNGTTYTFKLNPDARWFVSKQAKALLKENNVKNFDTRITARDYIYGIWSFNSAFPHVLKSVKDIKEIDEFTIQFVLSAPDYDLLYKLAAYPIYPCSKTFHTILGEGYGTTPDTVLTNGPYYIKSYDAAETIMERSSEYTGNIRTMNKSIVLYTTGIEDSIEERFKNGSYSIYTNGEASADATDINYGDVWGICFNCKTPLGSSLGIRSVLLGSIDYGKIQLPDFAILKAESIIPPDYSISDTVYSDFAGDALKYTTDTKKAQSTLDAMLKKYKKESYALRFFVPTEMHAAASTMIEDWKKLFGEKIEITLVTYNKKDAESVGVLGSYDFAILPILPINRTPEALLSSIGSAPCYYENSEKRTIESPIIEDRFNSYHSAEKKLIENGVFVPLFYTGTNLYLAEKLTGIYLADGGTQIYFHGGHTSK